MLTTVIQIFVLILTIASGRILLYDTENGEAIEKYDCVYYMHDNKEEIPYCRRLNEPQLLDRKKTECENQGELHYFLDLLAQNIHPRDVLRWSSSIETADKYARFCYNRSSPVEDDQFLCKCTKPGTFGKYCEYQFTHQAESFSEAIKTQFEQKRNGDSWNTQKYGNTLCYTTLVCDYGQLCLDWRDISDGTQRCSSGVDEENWDKLEFNECEDNEFRCTNGMCIPEEFWLDGHVDCMDWSDELYHGSGDSCSFTPNAMDCDEHVCSRNSYSCGDGQCVEWITRMAFQRFAPASADCFTKRNLNHMCEASPHRRAWTLESGLCSPDEGYDDPRYPPWHMMNASQLTVDEKCHYLFRCVLSKGFEHDCPCNHQNCTQMMLDLCPSPSRLILYPPEGLINPNVLIFYNYSRLMEDPTFEIFALNGGIKCRGYFFRARTLLNLPISPSLIMKPLINQILCTLDDPQFGQKDFLSPFQYDRFCWNASQTFSGRPYAVHLDTCPRGRECISQYRIHDGSSDCLSNEDEASVFDETFCTGNVGRQRFQCFNDGHTCFPLDRLGTGTHDCSNDYDEMWYGLGPSLRESIQCQKSDTNDCARLKEYIKWSSIKNLNHSNSLNGSVQEVLNDQMPFRSYCDSFWDLKQHSDESPLSCQYWVCQTHQYQCQTGQCIDLDWVCDGEWDCSDASDEEALVLIHVWSIHNARLLALNSRLEQCRRRYSQSPFSDICDTSFEFGCYRSGVSNPLDIQSNRPCINLTQIGDGMEDCYNAYDEKNTFEANSTISSMWGFHLRCENEHKQYPSACRSSGKNNCTNVLCSNHRDQSQSCSDPRDCICLEDNQCKKNARCNGIRDCLHGEDEYWCPSGSLRDHLYYRIGKKTSNRPNSFLIPQFPPENLSKSNRRQLFNSRNDSTWTAHAYQCNRGVAILETNEIRCLCPPAYYGRWCEFFSDRISVIASIDPELLPMKTFKIRTNFLFHDKTIDYHEFDVNPTFEINLHDKHKFYLLYSRSKQTLSHKQKRYFNRTEVTHNHPYSVHFDVFSFDNNDNRTKEIGSWRYPIHFDYLPAYRLAVVLRFPSWFNDTKFDPCRHNHCTADSICMPIFNQNNSYYCACKSGYHGNNCSIYEARCQTHCPGNAFCRSNAYDLQPKTNNPYCICSFDRFGPHCDLKHDDCNSNPCLNNGTCLSTNDKSGETSYTCVCSKRFHGDRCEHEMGSVRVHLSMRNASTVRASVVQLYSIGATSFQLLIQHQQVYHGFPTMITYYQSAAFAPDLGLVKIYENLTHSQYFIIYILHQSVINITSSPEHCPEVSSLLSGGINQSIPIVFKYHHICRNDSQRLCFYDETYLCICQSDHYQAECFSHNTQLDHCDKCLSGGKCIQGEQNNLHDFICLCPSSHYGHRCEFSFETSSSQTSSSTSRLTGRSNEIKATNVRIAFRIFVIGFLSHVCLIDHI